MKRRILAGLLALLLVLSGCANSDKKMGEAAFEELFMKMPASMEEGRIFFTGLVKEASVMAQDISFYEQEAPKSTFYKVEVTDDPFGCMPEREITVCILGASDTFQDRISLKKGKEYLFDTSLWVHKDEVVFLLPTFESRWVERDGETLRHETEDTVYKLGGTYKEYTDQLKSLAQENAYSPEKVLEVAKARFKSASERDAALFETLKFSSIDRDALKMTNQKAATLSNEAETAEKTWEGIGELLK